jgi:hypothetical protein
MLFRPEARHAHSVARLGTINLHRPVPLHLLTAAALGAVVLVGVFLCTAEYTRKARIGGLHLARKAAEAARAGIPHAFEFCPDLATAHGRKADADALFCHGSDPSAEIIVRNANEVRMRR